MSFNPYILAPGAMILGAAFLVINDAIVKVVAAMLPITQIIAIRSVVIAVICLVLIAVFKRKLFNPFEREIVLRTAFTAGNVFVFVSAVAVLPFAVVVLVDFTNIIYVALLAPLFLPERMTTGKVLAICLGFLGAAITLSPELPAFGTLIFLPLISALLGAGREIWTRRLGKAYSSEVLTLYAATLMATVAFAQGTDNWVLDHPASLALAGLAGIFQAAAMLLMTIALQIGDASYVTPFRLSALIWAILLAIFVFGEEISPVQLIGSALIVTALYLLVKTQASKLKPV